MLRNTGSIVSIISLRNGLRRPLSGIEEVIMALSHGSVWQLFACLSAGSTPFLRIKTRKRRRLSLRRPKKKVLLTCLSQSRSSPANWTVLATRCRSMPRGGWARRGFRHGSRILALAYSPNGRILAAGGGDDPVRLWDADTGREVRALPDTWVQALAFSRKGSVIATAGTFKTIRLWEVVTGKNYNKLEGHTAPIKAMTISPDGSMLASGGQDGTVILWELTTAKMITQFKGHTDEINALVFSPDSMRLASAGSDRSIRIWDCDNAKPLRTLDGGCCVTALAFSADGTALVSGGDDQLLHLWKVDEGKLTQTLKGHTGTIVSLLLARNGKIVSGARDRTVRFWDLSAGKETLVIQRNLGDSDALALTRDGKTLASAGINNTIRLFETAGGKEIAISHGHQAGVSSVALSPNGQWLASACITGQIRLWNAHTNQQVRRVVLSNWRRGCFDLRSRQLDPGIGVHRRRHTLLGHCQRPGNRPVARQRKRGGVRRPVCRRVGAPGGGPALGTGGIMGRRSKENRSPATLSRPRLRAWHLPRMVQPLPSRVQTRLRFSRLPPARKLTFSRAGRMEAPMRSPWSRRWPLAPMARCWPSLVMMPPSACLTLPPAKSAQPRGARQCPLCDRLFGRWPGSGLGEF